MTREERQAFRDEAFDASRTASLRAAAAATEAWDRAHPPTFDAYLDFLSALWDGFGPFAPSEQRIDAAKLRL